MGDEISLQLLSSSEHQIQDTGDVPQSTLTLEEILRRGDEAVDELRDYLKGYLINKGETITIEALNWALKISIGGANIRLVEVLLENKADPNGVVEFWSMIDWAIHSQSPDIFVKLWEAGAEIVYEKDLVRQLIELMQPFHKLTNWLMAFDKVIVTTDAVQQRQVASSINTNLSQTWLQIIQNDDVEHLVRLYDSKKWYNEEHVSMSFDTSQNFSDNHFIKIFEIFHENGLGILTTVKEKYRTIQQLQDIQEILTNLSGFKWQRNANTEATLSLTIDKVIIFPSFQTSCLLLAILSGRLQVIEALIRMRQFDILPAALFTCLLLRRIKMSTSLPDKTKYRLKEFVDSIESIGRDVLSRMSFLDNKTTLEILQTPLNTSEGLTLIDLADKANCSTVLSLPCCQAVLNDQWNDATNICQQMKEFCCLQPPRIKFWFHSLFLVVFLTCWSLVLLKKFNSSPTCLEYICMVYVLGYFVETVRLIYLSANDKKGGGLCFVFRQPRYWLDLVAILSTFVGFILRCGFSLGYWREINVLPDDTVAFFASRLFLLFGLLLFYFRLFPILATFPVLGPRLTMMKDMLIKDLLPLSVVFAIFIVAFGVVTQSLLYPNGKGRNGSAILNRTQSFYLFRRSFYGMFAAEYPLEELKCEDDQVCPNSWGSDFVLFGFHATFVVAVNISLINLLIALFSNTVANIAAKSLDHWLAKRYGLIAEYRRHSCLPPPFNCIICVIEVIQYCYQCRRQWCNQYCCQNCLECCKTKSTEINDKTKSTEIIDETISTEINDKTKSTEINDETKSTEINDKTKSTEINDETKSTEINAKTKSTEINAKTISTEINDETESTEINEENIWEKYLLLQAFAVRNQRHQLGIVKTDLQMKHISMEMSELRNEVQNLSKQLKGFMVQ